MGDPITSLIIAFVGPFGLGGALVLNAIGIPVSGGIIGDLIGIGPKKPKPSDGQQTVRVSVGSRVRHYGKVRIAGQLTFYESRDGTLYTLVTTGQGKLNAITEYLLNNKVVTVDGSGVVTTSTFDGKVSIHHRLGTDDQTAYSQLTSVFSPEWTTDHRQRGCSSLLLVARGVKSKDFAKVYEGGRQPEMLATVESSLVYDPRLDSTAVIGYDIDGDPIMGSGAHRTNDPATWGYSDNWALCFADYLAHPDGNAMGMDAINWTNIAGEADECDDTITTIDDRVIPKWRVAGSYRLADEERRAVIKEFLRAGDGYLWQDANGKANIRCGRWIAPTVHIPAKHIVAVAGSRGADALNRSNEVRIIYMEPRLGYVETEAAPQINFLSQEAIGRREPARNDALFIPDHNQAARVGKRALAQLGDRWQLTVTTNLYGLNTLGERFITMDIPELGIEALPFEVTGMRMELGDREIRVQLTVSEADEEDFNFNSAEEEGIPPGTPGSTTVVIGVEEMTGLSLAAVQVTLGGVSGVAIQATWDAPTRTDLTPQVQYREVGAADWLDMVVTDDSNVAMTGIVNSGAAFEAQGRFLTIGGRPSAWSAPVTLTPIPGWTFGTSMPPGVVFTRASTARFFNSTGVLTLAAVDVARLDCHPTTQAPLGLLIEPAGTNDFLGSETFANLTSSTNFTNATDGTKGPDGVTDARKMSATASAATVAFQNVTAGSANTLSLFVKKGTGASVLNRFGIYNSTTAANVLFVTVNLDTGSITYNTGASGAAMQQLENGWWRLTLTPPSGISNGDTITLYPCGAVGNSLTAGDFVYVTGVQFEAAAAASSYITAAGAPGTRSADVAQLDWSGRGVADGVRTIRYAFDDATTQDVSTTVAAGLSTIPTNLNRRRIKSITPL